MVTVAWHGARGAVLGAGIAIGIAPGSALRAQPEPDGDAHGLSATALAGVAAFLDSAAGAGAFPGGVLLVGYGGRVAYAQPFGRYGDDDLRRVDTSTVYDLASLTKVVGLTTAVMVLAAEGRLGLDDRVTGHVPSFTGGPRDSVRVRHLLTHTSGLPPWRPLYEETASRAEALAAIHATPLEADPGERYAYSDLGAIVLTEVVEAVAGESLNAFLDRRLFGPLGMASTRFLPPADWAGRIAPTEDDPWRGRVLRGEVHDENAHRLGGVSGHAGLFATAPDLARFAFWLLDAYHDRLPASATVRLPAPLVRRFTRRQDGPAGSTRALGWDTPSPGGRGSAGARLSPSSFGHTGFTGTSMWVDPERELVIILVTNRVHPSRDNDAIREVRRAVADAVVEALEGGRE